MQFGLGDKHASLSVYIANTPDYAELSNLSTIRPVASGEIHKIGQACGNGWRKVFNVYAKFIYALSGACKSVVLVEQFKWLEPVSQHYDSWQSYRDNELLQSDSNLNLCFSPLQRLADEKHLSIIMGRTYAKTLNIPNLIWLNEEFAISPIQGVIVCPYFDYRQLSNVKIIFLVEQVLKQITVSKNT